MLPNAQDTVYLKKFGMKGDHTILSCFIHYVLRACHKKKRFFSYAITRMLFSLL